MKYCATLLLCIAVVLNSRDSLAQGKLGAFVGAGTMFYSGDLQESFLPHPATVRWTVDAGLHWQITKRWGLQLNYTLGEITGSDQFAVSPGKQKRDLRFRSLIHEIGLRGTFDILRNDKWKLLPYLIAGVSAVNFEPKRDGVVLRPLATEGVGYSNWNVSFPTGLGLKYQINCQWALKGEILYHWTMTDYLDDVSGAYPDEEVEYYTDPGNSHPNRVMRGNPKWKDGFFDINIGVIFFFVGCGSSKKGGLIEDCDELYKDVDMDKLMERYK